MSSSAYRARITPVSDWKSLGRDISAVTDFPTRGMVGAAVIEAVIDVLMQLHPGHRAFVVRIDEVEDEPDGDDYADRAEWRARL